MSLFIASLNSGSNGNCYYIGNATEAVLVDAGLSCRETERRMQRMGLNMDRVKAIFVSHEHTDHISGINSICKKYEVPVYITPATIKNSRVYIDKHLIVPFDANEPVTIGGLTIKAFQKFHDADDPHSFIVQGNAVTIGVFTDLGVVCDSLVHHFQQCHAAFLEANYDEEMLANGGYPYFLKRRITGGLGHLSNATALDLFTNHRPGFMSHLILSHLSRNNNCPKLVHQLFSQQAGVTSVIVASRDVETGVFEVKVCNQPQAVASKQNRKLTKAMQMAMF